MGPQGSGILFAERTVYLSQLARTCGSWLMLGYSTRVGLAAEGEAAT